MMESARSNKSKYNAGLSAGRAERGQKGIVLHRTKGYNNIHRIASQTGKGDKHGGNRSDRQRA